MRGSALRKLGLTALVLALLTVIAILFNAWTSWAGFRAAEATVRNSSRVLEETNALYSGLRDAETGQRGFLLTGRETYLQPYYVGATAAAQHLRMLGAATLLIPSEKGAVDRLQNLISVKLAELQQTIDTRKTAGISQSIDIVQTDRGKAVMDEIRRICEGIQAHQYETLSISSAQLRSYEMRTIIITGTGSVALFVLLTSAILAIHRHTYHRDRLIQELDQSKREISQVRDLLQTTLGSIGDAVITTDNEGRLTFSNPVAQALTGWTEEMAYKLHLDKVFQIVNQETRQAVESPVSKVLRHGTIVGLANHTILIRKDGAEIHIDDSGAPIRDRDGNVMGVVLVFRDIGERRKAEIELESASRQTREILASIADGFISFDPAFRVLYANGEAARLFDCESADGLMGKVLWSECATLPGTEVGNAMLRAMKGRRMEEAEEHIGNRWISVRAYPSETGLSVYVIDVSERHRLMEDLHASQGKLHSSLQAAKAALWEWNLVTAETVWSDEFTELFGGAEQKLLLSEAQHYSLLHPNDRDLIGNYSKALLSGDDTSTNLEFRIFCSDEVKWICLVGRIVERAEGRPSRMAGLAIDVTDRKRLEDKLRDAAKLESLGVLAGGIAHDFNNLLTGILANASLAVEGISPGDPVFPLVGQVVEAGERAAELTRQMLAYSGKGSFVLEPLDISKEVREIVQLLRASVSHTVDLRLVLNESAPPVEADPAQIQQLVMNLVINAAEAMDEKPGAVTVTTGVQQVDERYASAHLSTYSVTAGPYVVLEVQDSGHGMDEATLARIFDPFFSTKFTGRGLGLAAVHGIVRGLKAGIEVHSNPGLGTTFKVFLPASQATQRTAALPVAPPLQTGGGIILVADDEKVVQQVAARALERRGFTVLLAANGQEAVDLFAEHSDTIRVIILDLTMPVMSGERALAEIRKIRANVPVLAASGFSESEALHRFGGGVEGFLQKPYTSSKLIEQVMRLVPKEG